ncbi:MAG: fumarylacetoacetate hydrolase family protein [Acidobacteriota bacterium]|nr:fumarylacetoacetate hydrolase family protein [Acidobacteriota bacterium]
MKLASFRVHGKPTWGVIEADHAVDLGATLGAHIPDLKALLQAGAYAEVNAARHASPTMALQGLEWLPVVPNPEKILCVGLNYETHRQETGRAVVSHPTIFTRFACSQTGHGTAMVRPKVSEQFDFEGELAVILGKPGRYSPREQALQHVAGYACYNDGSIRDWQYHTHQFTPGKNFPATGAFGPWMVTPDELPEFAERRIQTRLNGTVVQDAMLGQMIFDVATIVEYCSAFSPLQPGDVIVTGTPGGVGAKRTPPLWMKPGDTIEVEIDGVGLLRNHVVDEAAQ